MKTILLAIVAATFSVSVAPAFAKSDLTFGLVPASVGAPQDIERRSGRCPGGELRFFVPGCSGV